MSPEWFKVRGYRHFDFPVDGRFAKKVQDPKFVARHAFSPLIHYVKSEKKYKKSASTGDRSIALKNRQIKYASHRDACVLSYYAHLLNEHLETYYKNSGLNDKVLAYRAIGRANYDFSAEALVFAKTNTPVMILAFDVTGFFDNLDHYLLKNRLKSLLKVKSLPTDWHKIFRFITRFYYVSLDEVKSHVIFGPRIKDKKERRIASIAELKRAGIKIYSNPEISSGFSRGIPQGTPISAAASNLYMTEFDAAAQIYCESIGALYRRYSDDILVICKEKYAADAEAVIMDLIKRQKLEISPTKTEKTLFNLNATPLQTAKAAQYLGFSLNESGAAIRESSISRQWRKMKKAIKRTEEIASAKMKAGTAQKVYTKKLYRRFSYIKIKDLTSTRALRNFSSYGRRSASVFGHDEKITAQVKKFERAAQRKLKSLKSMTPSTLE